jgi:hypothetical protein
VGKLTGIMLPESSNSRKRRPMIKRVEMHGSSECPPSYEEERADESTLNYIKQFLAAINILRSNNAQNGSVDVDTKCNQIGLIVILSSMCCSESSSISRVSKLSVSIE